MLNMSLTQEELTEIKARFAVTKKLQAMVDERMAQFKAMPGETEKQLIDALAFSAVARRVGGISKAVAKLQQGCRVSNMAGKHQACQNCGKAQAAHPHPGCTQFLSWDSLRERINRAAGEKQPGKGRIQ